MNRIFILLVSTFVLLFGVTSCLTTPDDGGTDKRDTIGPGGFDPTAFAFEQSVYRIPIKKELQIKLRGINESELPQVEFSSSKPTYADIDEQGVVFAYKEGQAVITAKYKGQTATCTIEVFTPVYHDFSFDTEFIRLNVGQNMKLQLLSEGQPYQGEDPVTWISSDPSVLTVDDQGNVEALAFGAGAIHVENVNNSDNYAYIYFFVEDGKPTDMVDKTYLSSPFPYLKFPASEEEITMAERLITSMQMPLRKLVNRNERGDRVDLMFMLRDFYGHNPAVTMFGEVFYTINAHTSEGEPFAVAYPHGVRDEGTIEVMGSFLQDLDYSRLEKITVGEAPYTMEAWRAENAKEGTSVLIYLKIHEYSNGLPLGVMEWRKLEGDPYRQKN